MPRRKGSELTTQPAAEPAHRGEANPGPESERAANTTQVGAAPKAELASMKYGRFRGVPWAENKEYTYH